MESIPEDPYFEFRPDTLQEVRKEFNLHQPGAMAEVIKNFEEWIQKQNHFTKKDFSKHFIETCIILAKGSLERAKKNLDKLCTMKTLIPKFYSKCDVKNELLDLRSTMMPVIMPKMTSDYYRVFILKVVTENIVDMNIFWAYYRLVLLLCEYLKAHDYTQGLVFIVDVRNLNIVELAMKINLFDMKNLCTIILDGYGMRMKGIHVVSESKTVDLLVSVIRQMVSDKIGKRVVAHKTLDSVYDKIDRNLLPEDYGGKEKPFLEIYETLLNLLSKKENVEYFKDICKPGTNEAYRHTATYNTDILGIPGSFRNLTVD